MQERASAYSSASLLFTMAALFPLCAAGQNGSEEPIKSIFASARNNRPQTLPVSMDVEVTMFGTDDKGDWSKVPIQRMVKQYRQKGTMLDLVSARYAPDRKGELIDDDFTSRSIWSDEKALHRQGSAKHVYGWISKRDELSKRILFSDDGGNILDGFFPQNVFDGHWTDLFEKATDDVSVRPEKEAVGNRLCRVLEADTKYGKYTVWVDEENGCCIRQAKVSLGEENLAWGKPLRESYESKGHGARRYYRVLEVTVGEVVVERRGELYVPIEGTYVCRTRYDDGFERNLKRIIKRRNITFNPDFEAIGAFQMDMPDGTVVFDEDVPDVRYQWFAGKLVPYVEKEFAEAIDKKPQVTGGRSPNEVSGVANVAPTAMQETTASPPAQKPPVAKNARQGWLLWGLIIAVIAAGFAIKRIGKG